MISELMAGEETMLAPIESRKIAGMRDAGCGMRDAGCGMRDAAGREPRAAARADSRGYPALILRYRAFSRLYTP